MFVLLVAGRLAPAWAQEPPPLPPVAVMAAPEKEERVVPLRISLLPGFGLAASPNAGVNGVSVGVLSKMRSLEGIDAELGGSWVDGRMAGAQTAIGAAVAGEVDGLQAAVGGSIAAGDVRGMQTSVGVNVAAGTVRGVQATVGVNVAEAVEGVQATAGINVAGDVSGLQAAPLNVSGDLEGLQLGIVNVGRDVKGVQLGIVNVARKSDVSIGLLNFIGDGLHRIDLYASESAVGTAAVKFGSKHIYTLIGAGWVSPSQPYWTFGGGFGMHIPMQRLWFEADGSAWAIAEGNWILPGVHNKLRAQIGFDIAKHFAPFAGVSMNVWTGDGSILPRAVGLPSTARNDGEWVMWPGFHAGISF